MVIMGKYSTLLVNMMRNQLITLSSKFELLKETNPDRAYQLIEESHRLWTTRSNILFTFSDEESQKEAADLEWRAYDWALVNQQFIQQYKKEHPEITYRYFDNE